MRNKRNLPIQTLYKQPGMQSRAFMFHLFICTCILHCLQALDVCIVCYPGRGTGCRYVLPAEVSTLPHAEKERRGCYCCVEKVTKHKQSGHRNNWNENLYHIRKGV